MGRALDNAMLNVGQKDVAASTFGAQYNSMKTQMLTAFRGS